MLLVSGRLDLEFKVSPVELGCTPLERPGLYFVRALGPKPTTVLAVGSDGYENLLPASIG